LRRSEIYPLSDIALNDPEFMEMDINPLLVYPEGQSAGYLLCFKGKTLV
jgi:hypothetical protein